MGQFNCFKLNAWYRRCGALALVLFGLICAHPAQALPIFARQTGMACLACHTVYPELTHFGRMFKLNGYQLDNLKDITYTTDEGKQQLSITPIPGLAVFVYWGYTELNKALPDSQIPGAQSLKEGLAFPQQVSILYGGKIAPHFGAFAQLTYDDQAGTIGIDNTDFRFANNYILPDKGKLTYGLSINNNPSVQDIWNTTPAFGFPYVLTETFVPSLATPQIESATATNVAGVTAYVMWNEQLYGEIGIYRDAKQSTTNPITGGTTPADSSPTFAGTLSNNAPYWRVAYEYDIDRYALMVGGYGMYFKFYPGNGIPLAGLTNNYNDIAEDFQFQWIGEKNIVTLKGTHVYEKQTLYASSAAGASNPNDWLTYSEMDLTYYYMRKYGFALGVLSTSGSTDPLMYPAAPTVIPPASGTGPGVVVGVTNSAISNPQTNAWVAELNYLPWLNVKMTLQYTHYTKFNGLKDNYDGVGRNASDNNTTYFNMWFAF